MTSNCCDCQEAGVFNTRIKVGSIWRPKQSSYSHYLYIVSIIDNKHLSLICLNNGNRWAEPVEISRQHLEYNHGVMFVVLDLEERARLFGCYNDVEAFIEIAASFDEFLSKRK